jgi:enterochelin esterase-like enzyme
MASVVSMKRVGPPRYARKELLPWVRQKYQVTKDPTKTVIAGSSYGGLAATCAGMWYPEYFGNILSQSASYWWKPDGDSEYECLSACTSIKLALSVRSTESE